MNRTAQDETRAMDERMELSADVASMRASFKSLRQTEPQPIDLAAWYARVKRNSDGGATAPPSQSRTAA